MEFTISAFTTRLRELMYLKFPYLADRGRNPDGSFKHKNYNGVIRDMAFKNNPTITIDENTLSFDIGNEHSEERYPYYHILEDAPVIRKRGKGSAKTRGSQARVENLGQRDYNKVSWNGKTLSREYSRNVRGKRLNLTKISHYVVNGNGEVKFINREANSYLNKHYRYIERMLEDEGILDQLANEFGLVRKRTENTGLIDEFLSQDNEKSLIDEVLDSFNR